MLRLTGSRVASCLER